MMIQYLTWNEGDSLMDSAKPEPPPSGKGKIVYPMVLEDIRKRAKMGKEKYNTYLRVFNGRSAIKDLYDELLDGVQYIRQHIEEMESPIELEKIAHRVGWVAGIIDGEGCLSASGHRDRSYQLSLQVVNTDKGMINKLIEYTGVGICYLHKRGKNRFNIYSWHVSLEDATKILKAILPLLTTKKKEAELWIKLYEIRGFKKGERWTEKEKDLVKQIQNLKRIRNGKGRNTK
jgi:hypothetical protein